MNSVSLSRVAFTSIPKQTPINIQRVLQSQQNNKRGGLMLIPRNSFNDKIPAYTQPTQAKTCFFPLLEKIKNVLKKIMTFFVIETTEKEESKKETFTLFKVWTSIPSIQQLFERIVKVFSETFPELFPETFPTKLEIERMLEEDVKISRQHLLLLQETAFELDSFVLNHPDLKEICEECYVGSVVNSFFNPPIDEEISEWGQVGCQIIVEEHNIKARIDFVLTQPAIYNWLMEYKGSDMPELLKFCLTSTH